MLAEHPEEGSFRAIADSVADLADLRICGPQQPSSIVHTCMDQLLPVCHPVVFLQQSNQMATGYVQDLCQSLLSTAVSKMLFKETVDLLGQFT